MAGGRFPPTAARKINNAKSKTKNAKKQAAAVLRRKNKGLTTQIISDGTWYNVIIKAASLILLTYKGKILLMHRDQSPLIQNPWHFIEGEKEKNNSFEETIIKKVKEETSLKIEAVSFLSNALGLESEKYFYHAELTDKEVNSIQRDRGLTLGFYSFKEVKKLRLTESTKAFVVSHHEILEKSPN